MMLSSNFKNFATMSTNFCTIFAKFMKIVPFCDVFLGFVFV